MRDFIILLVHVIVTVIRLAGPGGVRSVVAESALLNRRLESGTALGNASAIGTSSSR